MYTLVYLLLCTVLFRVHRVQLELDQRFTSVVGHMQLTAAGRQRTHARVVGHMQLTAAGRQRTHAPRC